MLKTNDAQRTGMPNRCPERLVRKLVVATRISVDAAWVNSTGSSFRTLNIQTLDIR